MKITALVAMGILLAGCAQEIELELIEGPGYLPDHVRHEDDLLHHDDELLVLNPPPGYVEQAKALRLSVIDTTVLEGLGLHLYHMQIDTDHHPLHIRDAHEAMFPGVVVDVHHHFGHHAATVDKEYTGRTAINWGQGDSNCGGEIKIGMIDSAIASSHAAFASRDIVARSFLLNGQSVASKDHGTGVASVLIGNHPWGGLLPGARLYTADVFHNSA